MTRRLFRTVLVLAVVVACTNPDELPEATTDISITNQSDGTEIIESDGSVAYVAGGAFTATVTATFTGAAFDLPTRASVQITNAVPAPGAVTTGSAIASIVAGSANSYAASVPLAWPAGGLVSLQAELGGVTITSSFVLETPALEVQVLPQQQVGAGVTIPICIESNVLSGSLALHMDGGGFSPGSAADATVALVPGGCGQEGATMGTSDLAACPGGAPSTGATAVSTVHSHALITAAPGIDPLTHGTSTSITFVAALQGSSATAPPNRLVEGCIPVALPRVIDVVFLSPADGAQLALAQPVNLVARATYADDNSVASGVTFSFTTSPNEAVVPAMVTTDAFGSAFATIGLPDLKGGSLVISSSIDPTHTVTVTQGSAD